MSDSLANLAVKVDVTSVAAAMRQLEALATTAGRVEAKVGNIGAKVNQNTARAATNATQAAKSSGEAAGKLDRAIASQIRTVDSAKSRYEAFDRAIRQSNLAVGVQTGLRDQAFKSLDRYLKAITAEGVTAKQTALAQTQFNRSMRDLNHNFRDGQTLINNRIRATRELTRETLNAGRATSLIRQMPIATAIQDMTSQYGTGQEARIRASFAAQEREALAAQRAMQQNTVVRQQSVSDAISRQMGSFGTGQQSQIAAHYKAMEAGILRADAAQAKLTTTVESARRAQRGYVRSVQESGLAEGVRTGHIMQAQKVTDDYIRTLTRQGVTKQQTALATANYGRAMEGLTQSLKRNSAEVAANVARQVQGRKDEIARLRQAVALERDLGAARLKAGGMDLRAARQLPMDVGVGITRQTAAALGEYERVVRQFGLGTREATDAKNRFNTAMQRANNEISRQGGLLKTLNGNARTTAAAFGSANTSMRGFGRVVFSTQAALAALMGTLGLREIVNAMMNLERFSNTLRTVSGDAVEFNNNMRFLFSEGDRIGFSVSEVGNSFARLSIAMQGAGFTALDTRETFTGLATAARNFGASSADTMGVIRALEQSMSKGKFMAEEVRLQMGDRLPVAMAALQAAVEKVDGEFSNVSDRMERGTLDVQRYGVEFVRQIAAMSGGTEALERTSQSISAAFGRLANEWIRTIQALEDGGFGRAVIVLVDQMRELAETLRDNGAFEIFGQSALAVASNLDVLAGAVAGLVSGKLIFGLMGAFGLAAAAASPLVAGIIALTGGLIALYTMLSLAPSSFARFSSGFSESLRRTTVSLERSQTEILEAQQTIERGTIESNRALQNSFETLTTAAQAAGVGIQAAQRQALETMLASAQAQAAEFTIQLNNRRREQQEALNEGLQIEQRLLRISNRVRQSDRNRQTLFGISSPEDNSFREWAARYSQFVAQIGQTPEPLVNVIARITQFKDELEAMGRASGLSSRDLLRMQQDTQSFIDTLRGMDNNTLLDQERGFGELEAQIKRANDQVREYAALIGRLPFIPFIANDEIPRVERALPDWTRVSPATRRRQTAENNLMRNIAPLIGPEGSGAAFRPNVRVEEVLTSLRRTASGASGESPEQIAAATEKLKEFNDEADKANESAKQLSNFFRTLTDATAAASDGEGIAGTLAQRYRELDKAIEDSKENVDRAAARLRVYNAVMEAGRAASNEFIRRANLQATANRRIASAYMESSAAGRRAVIEQEAYTKALEFTERQVDSNGRAIGRYREEIERLIPVITREKEAETSAANARGGLNERRQEIALLEEEGRLIGGNANIREQEVAALQERHRLINSGETDQALIRQSEQLARRVVSTRQQNTQIENSFEAIANIGSEAFERVGNSITEAFANGSLRALSFRDIFRGVMSSVIQQVARLAVLNPIMNSLFGGTRATLSTALTGVSSIGDGGGGTLLGSVFGGYGSLKGGGAKGGNAAGGGGFFGGGNMFTSLGGMGGATSYLFGGAMGPGGMGPPTPGLFGTGGQLFGMDASALIGGIGGIAAGALGIYSGIQRGGIGGAVQGIGGGLGMVAGAASLGLMGTAMAALAPILGPAALLVGLIGAFLPGQKPSSKAGLADIDFDDMSITIGGFEGNKFSQENRDAAKQVAEAILEQARRAEEISGFRAVDRIAVEMGDRAPGARLYSRFGTDTFERDEAGARALSERAAEALILSLQDVARNFDTVEARITLASKSLEELEENFKFFREVYTPLIEQKSAFEQQMEALAKSYNDVIEKAKELSLETDILVKKRDEELKKMQEARDREFTTLSRGLAARAQGQNALAEMIEQQNESANAVVELTKRLTDLGATAQEITRDVNNLRIAQLVQQRAALGSAIREMEGRDSYMDAVRNILQARDAIESAGLDPYTLGLSRKLNDLQLESVGRGLAPTTIQSALSTFQTPQVQTIFTRVLAEQRNAAMTDQRDVIDTAQGRGVIVQAREMIRAFEQMAPQLGALGLGDLAWQSLAAQLENFMQGLAEDQLRLLTAFDNMAGRLEDDLIRGIAETTLKQRELAEVLERTRSAEERVIRSLSTLIDFTRNLQVGALSALSPQAQFELAQQQFEKTVRNAQGGDFAAIERLPTYAETYLSVARDLFGSGQMFADVFGKVVGTLEGVAETPADTLTASAMAVEIQTQTQTLVGELTRLREEVSALKAEVIQQGITPTRIV